MYRQIAIAVALAVSVGQAMADCKTAAGNHWTRGGVVTVSCYRGPFKKVIWDRPNAIFTDSLVAVGYSEAYALGIGNRICRDPALVDDTVGMKSAMEAIIAATAQ